MKTKNTHGGSRKGAGAKKKPKGEKKIAISITCYGKEKHDKEYMRNIAKEAGQKAIDNLG